MLEDRETISWITSESAIGIGTLEEDEEQEDDGEGKRLPETRVCVCVCLFVDSGEESAAFESTPRCDGRRCLSAGGMGNSMIALLPLLLLFSPSN